METMLLVLNLESETVGCGETTVPLDADLARLLMMVQEVCLQLWEIVEHHRTCVKWTLELEILEGGGCCRSWRCSRLLSRSIEEGKIRVTITFRILDPNWPQYRSWSSILGQYGSGSDFETGFLQDKNWRHFSSKINLEKLSQIA